MVFKGSQKKALLKSVGAPIAETDPNPYLAAKGDLPPAGNGSNQVGPPGRSRCSTNEVRTFQ